MQKPDNLLVRHASKAPEAGDPSSRFRGLLQQLEEQHETEIAALQEELARFRNKLQVKSNCTLVDIDGHSRSRSEGRLGVPRTASVSHSFSRDLGKQVLPSEASTAAAGDRCEGRDNGCLEFEDGVVPACQAEPTLVSSARRTARQVLSSAADEGRLLEALGVPEDEAVAAEASLRQRFMPTTRRSSSSVERDFKEGILEEPARRTSVSSKSTMKSSVPGKGDKDTPTGRSKDRGDYGKTELFVRDSAYARDSACSYWRQCKPKKFVILHVWHNTHSLMKASQEANFVGAEPSCIGVRKEKNRESATPGSCSQKFDKLAEKWMLDPGSRPRSLWSGFSLLLLVFDIVVVPLDCFMEMPPNQNFHTTDWIARVFWSVDIPLNFMTGAYINGNFEMRPTTVALNYAKTWLLMDLVLVSSDWLTASGDQSDGAQLLPLLRSFRLLRLMRLLRIAKLQQLVSDLMTIAPDGIVGCAGILKLTMALCIYIHVLACVWFGIGTSTADGWAKDPEIEHAALHRRYFISVHWTVLQLNGSSGSLKVRDSNEFAFASLVLFLGFILLSLFVGNMSHTVAITTDKRKEWMRWICRKYLRSRRVSPNMQIRLNKYLAKSNKRSFKEQVEQETELLRSLPELLRLDLNEETRKPLLMECQFFREVVHHEPRVVRLICFEAMSCLVGVKNEYIFLKEDPSSRMLFVEMGLLTYSTAERADDLTDEYSIRAHSRAKAGAGSGYLERMESAQTAIDDITEVVGRGAYLSEPALWTRWCHVGDLVAENDATLLSLEVKSFTAVITQNEASALMAVNYARHYIVHLNKLRDENVLWDTVKFETDFSTISIPPEEDQDDECLMFLSHFKQEAGTEATLMEGYFTNMIREDEAHPCNHLTSPCFLDSSNLTDLTTLTDRVRKAHNLILLLTPRVLYRPWCLVEIVTALRSNVNVIPVEIQRPGLKFQYPTEAFYEAFSRGDGLSKADIALLKEEGIQLDDVVTHVRQVFLKIALPFSPHKSANIRTAELQDILNRCVVKE